MELEDLQENDFLTSEEMGNAFGGINYVCQTGGGWRNPDGTSFTYSNDARDDHDAIYYSGSDEFSKLPCCEDEPTLTE